MLNEKCPRENCGADLVATPDGGLKCSNPECTHSVLPGVKLADNIGVFKQGTGVQVISARKINGLPERELNRSSVDGGPSSSSDWVRSEDGTSNVTRSIELPSPYQRKRGIKEREEEEAVQRILNEYNRNHSTDFDGVRQERIQDHSVDVWITKLGSEAAIPCQVTMGEKSKTFGSLAQTGAARDSGSEDELVEMVRKAIKKKHENFREETPKGTILVLDVWVLAAESFLDRFQADCPELLDGSPFAEIWYSGRGVGAFIKRLK